MEGDKSWFAGSRRDLAAFVLLALLLAAAAWVVALAAGPFEADPDFIYLLNGLELLRFHVPSYYTHPGTPVEISAALVIVAAWLASLPWHGFFSVKDQVLAHPGFYMGWIDAVFVACIAAALVFFAWQVRKASGRLFPAIAGGLTLFLPLSTLLAVHRVTPEPLLLAGGLVLAGLLAPFAFAPGPFAETKKLAGAIGAAIGFCIAIKATAAPLLIMILVLRGTETRKIASAACLLAAVIMTLPVAPHYLEMTLWYIGLFTHQGGYGSGAVGVPGISVLMADAGTLVAAMPETFACLILYGFVILLRPKGGSPLSGNAVRVLIFCILFVAANLLAVLKQPEVRYTIPTVPFLCLGNAIVARYFFQAWGRTAILAALVMLGLWTGSARTEHMRGVREANEPVLRKVAESGCLPAYYYSVNNIQFNLYFGNGWTHYVFKDELARLYPDFVSFHNGTGTFENYSGPMTGQEVRTLLARRKCIYLVGSPIARVGDLGVPQRFLSLVAQSSGGPREAIAVYALKRDWLDGQ